MKLTYTSLRDDDLFILTDFGCEPAQELLRSDALFKVLWSQEADVELRIDGYTMTLHAGEILFCTPLNIMEIPISATGLIATVFNKEFFCIQTHDDQVSCHGFLFFGSSEPQRLLLTSDQSERLRSLMDMIREDLHIQDHLQGEMLRSLLKRLLIQSTRIAQSQLPEPSISPTHMSVIREYNVLVEKHFREHHHVKDYAALLYKSPKTLANIFPKYTDKSPLAIINDRILLEARRLLIYSDSPTSEIAVSLGYKDPGHFSKFFKKHTGSTPSAYRKLKRAGQAVT